MPVAATRPAATGSLLRRGRPSRRAGVAGWETTSGGSDPLQDWTLAPGGRSATGTCQRRRPRIPFLRWSRLRRRKRGPDGGARRAPAVPRPEWTPPLDAARGCASWTWMLPWSKRQGRAASLRRSFPRIAGRGPKSRVGSPFPTVALTVLPWIQSEGVSAGLTPRR